MPHKNIKDRHTVFTVLEPCGNVFHFTKQLHELTPLQVARKVHSPFGDGNHRFAAAHKHSTITGSSRVSTGCCFRPLLRTRASRVAPDCELNQTHETSEHILCKRPAYVQERWTPDSFLASISRQPLLEGTVLS